MRTTVDLAPDLLRRLRSEARRRRIPMKVLLDEALRRGLASGPAAAVRTVPLPTFAMGAPRPGIDLDRALATVHADADLGRGLADLP